MIAPVLRIFLADPAVSTPAKEEVRRSLAAACSDAVPFFEPVAAVLGSLLSVAETPLRATPRQFHSTLTELQQCIAHPTGDSASLLHRLLAMLQYFSFHQKLTSPEMAHNICMALFPASVSSLASIEELSTPAVKGLPLELILEYGSLLLDCLIQTDATISCLIDISIKLLGSFACLEGNEVYLLVNRHSHACAKCQSQEHCFVFQMLLLLRYRYLHMLIGCSDHVPCWTEIYTMHVP